MKILSIGSDRKIFEQGSAVRTRLIDYGQLVEELHVIVFAKRRLRFLEEKIAPNIFLYTADSFSRICYVPSAVIRSLKLKRSGVKIDVVTTQDPFEAGVAGYIIARIFKARLHIQVHTDVMSPYFASESLLNRVRVIIAKFLIPRADAIRIVSERIKKSIEKIAHTGVSITVLPIFVEIRNIAKPSTGDLKRKYPQFHFHILIAARLSREKNIEGAIEAMLSVVKINPKAGLVIVGSGNEEVKLKKLVTRLFLEKNVIFEGWQDNLSGYYKTADVLVLPSYYEGYGMVIIEALSAGCPVIMTDVGCAGDVVKDHENGLIVPVGDIPALANAIGSLASGNVKLDQKIPKLPTKEEYLATYRKSWEDALL